MRFCNLSFDFSKLSHIYKDDNHWQWYDNCKWYQSEGSTVTYPRQIHAVRNVGFNGLYITNSTADEMLYGFAGCNLVRGSHCSNITGDVFQMSRMVVNCTVDKVDGAALEHHTDLFQWWGPNENIIIYGVKATNVDRAQNFFFGMVPDGTGVINNDSCVINVIAGTVAGPFQFVGHQFRVQLVHLAAHGFDIIGIVHLKLVSQSFGLALSQ